MSNDAKIKNPIVIRIDNNGEVSIVNEDDNSINPISNGIMFGTIHYGFIIISDYKGVQREIVYPTNNSVDAIGVSANGINVYEEGVRESWVFDKKGKLVREMPENPIRLNFTLSEKAVENSEQLLGVHRVSKPLTIVIDSDDRIILFDNGDEYPINPGVMIGDDHYGFILIRNIRGRQIERVFPTQNRIEAVGVSSQNIGTDFDIFEEGKYKPWKFDKFGKLLQEGAYLEASRKDINFVNSQIENNKSLTIK